MRRLGSARVRRLHAGEGRGHLDAGPEPHQPVDDHVLVRGEPLPDHPEPVDDPAQFDPAIVDGAVGLEDVDELPVLVGADRAIADQHRVERSAAQELNAREHARREVAVLVAEDRARTDGPGVGVELVVDEVDVAAVRKAGLVREAHSHRVPHAPAAGARALAVERVVAEVGLLVALEVDVHRVDRHDGCEERGVGPALHDVAGGDLGAADTAADGRPHQSPVEVELRGAHRRLCGLNAGVGLGAAAHACVVLLAGDRVLGDKRLGPLGLAPGQPGLGLRAGQLGLGAIECVPILARVDPEEHVTLLHFVPLGERHLVDEARHPRPHLDVSHRLDPPGELVPFVHGAPDGGRGRDGWWRRRGRRRPAAGCDQKRDCSRAGCAFNEALHENLSSKGWEAERKAEPRGRGFP